MEGASCVIVPSRPPRTQPKPEEKPNTINIDLNEKSQYWAGLAVFDGETGSKRWERWLPADGSGEAVQIDHILAGPDIDGDGVADLFVASFGEPFAGDPGVASATHHFLFVTALYPLVQENMAHDRDGFPVERTWADARPDLFAPVFSADGVRIYRLRTPARDGVHP